MTCAGYTMQILTSHHPFSSPLGLDEWPYTVQAPYALVIALLNVAPRCLEFNRFFSSSTD